MKILHISDTHGCHKQLKDLPAADVIVHSGDFCMDGTEDEAIDFLNWFCDLPYRHKIFICGNRDECLYESNVDGLDDNVHYLCNSSVEIDGVKFYGVSMFMEDCLMNREEKFIKAIPSDTDVLITHEPPYGVLDFADDFNYGSEDLLERVCKVKPRLHLFGHIHAQNGVKRIYTTTYCNASIMNDRYLVAQRPHVIAI
jgi:Icc-related predicted phosphoesterase